MSHSTHKQANTTSTTATRTSTNTIEQAKQRNSHAVHQSGINPFSSGQNVRQEPQQHHAPPVPPPIKGHKKSVGEDSPDGRAPARNPDDNVGAGRSTSTATTSAKAHKGPAKQQRHVAGTSSGKVADHENNEAAGRSSGANVSTRSSAASTMAKSSAQAGQTGATRPRANPSQQHHQQQQQAKGSHEAGAQFAKSSSQDANAQQQNFSTTPQLLDDDSHDGIVIGTADDEELIGDNSNSNRGLADLPSDLTAGLTKNLIWAVFASTVGSSFQHGYNGGVVNAPEHLLGQFVNATYTKRHGHTATETQVDFIVAIIVSIFCIGGCFGALLTAFVADRIGRKEGLMYNNIMVLIAAPMMASAKAMSSYELLILGRFLIGINAGLNAGLAPLYLNEIAPVRLRGALGTIYQLVITISILLSNIFGLPSLLGDESSWPILFAIPIVPAAFMLAALPHCCESPKHLILNLGRELQAQQALAWLRQTGDIQEEMDELRSERELQAMNQRSIALGDMWYDSSLRKPMTIAIVIMLSQQLSGINAVLFFSTSIFRDAGLDAQAAVRATLGMGLVNVIMTLVSLFLVDRAGRRTLHMTGLMGMAATSLVLALCLSDNSVDKSSLTSGLAVIAVYVYIGMFAIGPGAIPWFLVAELFPSSARPLASSIAVSVNWLANFTVSLCFLPLSNILHGFTFILFAILLVIFYLFTYYKVPETKGVTADEISALFKR